MELSKVITTDFLKHTFQKYLNKEVSVKHFSISDLSTAGENYNTQLKMIVVTYSINNWEDNTMRIIAKYFPEDEYLANFNKELKSFECELNVYGFVIPQISKLDYREKVAAQVYYLADEPLPIILLEDLSVMNYKLPSRREGLDLQHCFFVVEKLAYFHAASVALHEQDPAIFKNHNEVALRKHHVISSILDACYDNLIQISKSHPELHMYSDKLKLARNTIYTRLYSITNFNSKLKVLNHGDCWCNNVLFRYNTDGSLADLAFVDFQYSYFGSPNIDLHYFLASSVKLDIKPKYKLILDHYFRTFIQILGKLHTKTIPKFEDIIADFRSLAVYGFVASLVTLSFIKASRTDGATLENFINDGSDDSFQSHCFSTEAYQKEMRHCLPFYDSLGVFDI